MENKQKYFENAVERVKKKIAYRLNTLGVVLICTDDGRDGRN